MNQIKKIIKRTLHTCGVDIVRYHENKPLEFLKDFGIETVIDAGANIGQFAQEVRQVLPHAHIHSFEPMKDAFEKLSNTLSGDSNFTPYNFALGDREEKTTIHKNSYSPSSSILRNTELLNELFPFTQNSEEEKIQVERLDSVLTPEKLKKNVLLKLDVQGYESKVLGGGANVLKVVHVLLIETSFHALYEGQPLFDDMYSIVKKAGFTYHGSAQIKRHPKTGIPLFEDSIFIRE